MKKIDWPAISGLLSIATGLLVAYNTFLVNKFDNELTQIESERELNFKIYTSVTEALESENEQRISAVKVIVNSMANDQLKPGFLEILKTGEARAFDKADAESFVEKKAEIAADEGIPIWKTWNFDLFWCEKSGVDGERLAREIENLFKQNEFPGRLRVRYLPESVTQRTTFSKPAQFEIRVDAGEEHDNAEKIIQLINETSSIKETFNIYPVSKKNEIPGYVSLFFCP